MKVLITGATGLVGKPLAQAFINLDIEVHYLTTQKNAANKIPGAKAFYWNPEKGIIDNLAFEGVHTIINLAGASIAEKWTKHYKQQIVESRVLSATLLYKALKNNPYQVKHLINASAIGLYPTSYKKTYQENDSKIADNFLGRVVKSWEESVYPFNKLGIKTSILRFGIVLSSKGGAWPSIQKPINLYMGSAIGNGKQYQSWIHIQDVVSAVTYIQQQELEGTYNIVAPNPVIQLAFTKIAAGILRKKIVLPSIPVFVLKLILGERSVLVTDSQRVSCQKLLNTGFVFQYNYLHEALKDLTKKGCEN